MGEGAKGRGCERSGPRGESYPAAYLFGGGSHEQLATSAGTAGHIIDLCAYPHLASIKHEKPTTPSQPAPYQHVQQGDHHHDPEHYQGSKQAEGHCASNTPSSRARQCRRGLLLPAHPLFGTPECQAMRIAPVRWGQDPGEGAYAYGRTPTRGIIGRRRGDLHGGLLGGWTGAKRRAETYNTV